MHVAAAMAGVTKGALGFFDFRPHRMQIIGRRDHRKQQHQHAAERAEKYKRSIPRAMEQTPAPPQQVRGQQQGQPTKIKEQLHANGQRSGNDPLKIIRVAQREEPVVAVVSQLFMAQVQICHAQG